MKYLKLFENNNLSVDDATTVIIKQLQDDYYFERYVPYAKKKEQFKRLIMLICHRKAELENIRSIMKLDYRHSDLICDEIGKTLTAEINELIVKY